MAEQDVRTYAEAKHFGPSMLERWLAKRPSDRDALLDFALRLRLGQNQFRDLLNLLEDIAARQGSGLREVIASPPVVAVMSRDLGRNEAIKAIKTVLSRLRYPQLSEIESRLAALVQSIHLPRGARVEFPANLEGEHVSVILSAAGSAELRAQANALMSALEGPEVDQIFALLEGDW
jgi:hypothetical protein